MLRPCPTCALPYEDYAALYACEDAPPLAACTLCRSLEKPRQRHEHSAQWVPRDDLEEVPQASVSRQERPRVSRRGRRWTKPQAMEAIHAWVVRHDGRFPMSVEMDHDGSLPTAPTVRSLWHSVPEAFQALEDAYPELAVAAAERPSMTRELVLRAIQDWLTVHPGEVLLSPDLQRDPTLPTYSVVYRHVGSLRKVYLALEQRGIPCFARYLAAEKAARQAAMRHVWALGERPHKETACPPQV